MLTLKETSIAGDYELPPAGTHAARCHLVADLGTVESTFDGKTTASRKLLLGWTLAESRTDGKPHTIFRRYTASLGQKAALRQMLESWRAKAFTPEELKAFDVARLAGAPAMLNIIHVSKGDRVFANIASVGALPRGLQAPRAQVPEVVFDLDSPDAWADIELLPAGVRRQVEQSPEWQSIAARRGAPAPAAPAATAPAGSGFDDMSDDIPF
jgi:hypothetical protein